MSLNGEEDMDSVDRDSQPPSPPLHVDNHLDNRLCLGAGGGASVPDLVVPVPAAHTTTASVYGSLPSL